MYFAEKLILVLEVVNDFCRAADTYEILEKKLGGGPIGPPHGEEEMK